MRKSVQSTGRCANEDRQARVQAARMYFERFEVLTLVFLEASLLVGEDFRRCDES
jgi:hypothetical protein